MTKRPMRPTFRLFSRSRARVMTGVGQIDWRLRVASFKPCKVCLKGDEGFELPETIIRRSKGRLVIQGGTFHLRSCSYVGGTGMALPSKGIQGRDKFSARKTQSMDIHLLMRLGGRG